MVKRKRTKTNSGFKVAKKSSVCSNCGTGPCICPTEIHCNSGLHPMHLGMTLGITWGIALFAMTAMGIETGTNTFIGLIFKQYVSMPTAMAGGIYSLVYGFIDGFFGGLIIASLYNKLNRNCKEC